MPDREKAIKGLEQFKSDFKPFFGNNADWKRVDDALTLLKEQEPRLLTIEEITGGGECWFEGINGACGYADCYMLWPASKASKEVEVNRISMKPEYVSLNDFMKKWRCWTFMPTYEQSKAVKWE